MSERSAVAAVRCLTRAGYDVTAIDTSRLAPGMWSRAPRARHITPPHSLDVAGYIDSLEELFERTPHDFLLASTDAALCAVSLHRERLEQYVRLGIPSHELVLRALDRAELVEAADRVGLGYSDTCVCETADDALDAAEDFGYPILVKPTVTVIENHGSLVRRASAQAATPSELARVAERFGRSVVQRRVGGTILSVAGLATEQGLVAVAASRYLRTWPAEAGSACFSETIAPAPELIDRVSALVAQLGWTGMFEVELIETPDGRHFAIDFNPRVYGSLSLAVAAGVPLPALWCDWQLGQLSGEPAYATVGGRYRWALADLRHLMWSLRGSGGPGLWEFRPRAFVTHPYFEITDPLPSFVRVVQIGYKAPALVTTPKRKI